MGARKDTKHWTSGCTERINDLRDQYSTFTPTIDVARAQSFTRSFKETEAEDTIIRRAKALYRTFAEKKVVILPGELVVGTRGSGPRAAELTPDHTWRWIKDELDTVATRPYDPYQIGDEQKRVLVDEVFPYWEGKSLDDYYQAHVSDRTRSLAGEDGILFAEAKSLYGPGEIGVGFRDIVFKHGFKGVKEQALKKMEECDPATMADYDKIAFWQAVVVSCDAMHLLGERYAEEALRLAKSEGDAQRREELLAIAEHCARVPWEPPRTFWEAVQAIHFTEIALWTEQCCASICPGRIDQILYDFYRKDIESGELTSEEAQELIECLWIKLAEILPCGSEETATFLPGYQPFLGITVGGVNPDGSDAVNELSFMMIQASMDVRLHAPSLNVRLHPEASDDFVMKVVDLASLGDGLPAIMFDPAAIGFLERMGVPVEDARDWAICGCVEPAIPGKMSRWAEGCRYTYAQAVEWALSNGVSRISGKKLGLSTGDPRSFATYEELEDAVKRQLEFLISESAAATRVAMRANQERLPLPLMSACIEGCVDSGIDVSRGGSLYYGGPGFETTGIADLGDSLAAVKKFVYDDHRITMDELLQALDDDFVGHEELRTQLVFDAPKYGNDEDDVDEIVARLLAFAAETTEQHRDLNGGIFRDGLVPNIGNVPHGLFIGALPSGRRAGEPLADGISPFMGYDRSGPTAVIKSVCKVDHTKHQGTLLNMKFTPALLQSETGKKSLGALMKSVMALGGYHVQFNVVSAKTLRAAQETPEDYGNLLVRVAGYSAFFVELNRVMQDALIARTEISTW